MDCYELIILLNDIKPPIWRKLLVPSHISLTKLHQVLQVVMGWQNQHCYCFLIDDVVYQALTDSEDTPLVRIQHGITLDSLKLQPDSSFGYLYDFGDSWYHTVQLTRIIQDTDLNHPVCLSGQRRCPPEDCGGVPGYLQLLEIIFDPKDPAFKMTLEWLGGYFQPEDFNKDAINRKLHAKRFKASANQVGVVNSAG